MSQCLVTCLEAHAHDHFYALFGISRSGYAFGMLISPLLAAYLMDIYGWRGAMLIMGAITCNLIPLTVMVDTNIHDKSENVATSDSVKYHNHSEERSIEDRDRSESSLKECSLMVTYNGLNNDVTVGSENESILRHTEHCQGLISGRVQDECDEMQDTTLQQYKEPLGDRCPTTMTTASEQDKGDMCSDSCSLMEINYNLQSPTHGRHQQGVNDLSSSGTNHPSADTTSKLSLKRIRRTLMDSVYNQDRCLIVIVVANAFVAMLHGGWHAFFIPRALSRGKSLYSTLCLLYSTSIACFLSRIFIGVILTSKLVSGYDLFLLLRLVNIASMLVDIFSANFAVMIVTSFITSFAINEENMFMIFVSKERSPSSAFPFVFAMMQISFGLGALIGTYLTGMKLNDCFSRHLEIRHLYPCTIRESKVLKSYP